MRNDTAILGGTHVHADIPVNRKAFYMKCGRVDKLPISIIISAVATTQHSAQRKEGGWVWLSGKYPAFKFQSEIRSIFQGNIAPTPREVFIIGKCLQPLKCRTLFQCPRSGVIILLALIGSNYCLTLATYTLFQILSHVM